MTITRGCSVANNSVQENGNVHKSEKKNLGMSSGIMGFGHQ